MRAHVTREQLVVGQRVAVEVGQQAAIQRAQALGRDRLAALDHPVRLELVVGEQHLAVERAGDLVDGVLQQHDALARIGRAGQHVVEQQRLAQRRRHLGDEDRVARIHERLRLVRQHRVHRVAHLVGQREDAVERVVPVEQHVRVHAVDRRRVGAAVLARVLVDVDPALGEGAPDARLVVGAEHRRRVDDPVGDVVVRDSGGRTRRAGWCRRRGDSCRGRARACAAARSAAAARRRRAPVAIRFSTTDVGMALPSSAASSIVA